MKPLYATLALAAFALPIPGHAQSVEELLAAAKSEPPLTVFDSTGKIVEMAENFAAKYGLQAVGTKVKAEASIEMIAREARAGNVQGDVHIISDGAAVLGQLVPSGAVVSWVPPDLEEKIDPIFRDPLVVVSSANVWAYNTELNETCPVGNIWQLTEPEWKGRVAMQDPLGKSVYSDFFSQLETHDDDAVAKAYADLYGKPLETGESSATKAWIKALAQNGPLLGSSDSAAAEAVGAPGQKEAFMGLMSAAKFRENSDSGFKLGLCKDIEPFVGFRTVGVGVIAAGTDSPNAARLFIHYALTDEGIAPQAVDGKMSSNSDVGIPDDEPSGIAEVLDRVLPYDISSALQDWDTRQDWQDFWRVNYER